MDLKRTANYQDHAAEPEWGAVAVAAVGGIRIELEESTDDAWRLNVDSPRLFVSFNFPDANAVLLIRNVLLGGYDPAWSLDVRFIDSPFRLTISPDELGTRRFLHVKINRLDAQFTLSVTEAESLRDALWEVVGQASEALGVRAEKQRPAWPQSGYGQVFEVHPGIGMFRWLDPSEQNQDAEEPGLLESYQVNQQSHPDED